VFPNRRFYIALTFVVLLIGGGYLFAPLFTAGKIALALFGLATATDIVLLYSWRQGVKAHRICAERFSNGDDNKVRIHIENAYPYALKLSVIDEIPYIFQDRDVNFTLSLKTHEAKDIVYKLRPTHRGVYAFGLVRVFASSPIGLIARRYSCGSSMDIKVYPSFLMLHQYELLAISNNLTELGIKRIRRIGQHTEFEQIKEYTKGDDFRTINWKATARRHALMVNIYQDERSQRIYSVIDKGRVMQQAFKGMTLLDYSINASLMLSYVAMKKEDKAGLATFADRFDTFVPAAKEAGHLQVLLENLYSQQTSFGETDFSSLCVNLNKDLNQRSLLVIYTNFANLTSMKRQLPFLRQLSHRHKVLVVFFEDSDLNTYVDTPSTNTEAYFRHVIAEKYVHEKRLIVNTLRQYGIYSLLTTPDKLSIDVINRYLEMKAQQLI
jgi:uncharacterized protein (DUF58 family)